MLLMISYLDLFLPSNQLLVAQDWVIYQHKIIISDELRWKMEDLQELFLDKSISKIDLENTLLDFLQQEFIAQSN